MRIQLVGLLVGAGYLFPAATVRAEEVMEWTIDGVVRKAIVIPGNDPDDRGMPLILAFHGHGETMESMAQRGFQKEWPEAMVVCPQGLPTASPIDREGKESGWQRIGRQNNDRDLKLVDKMLATLSQKHKIDDQRVFAVGYTNGGVFNYLLWVNRGKKFAALGSVAAAMSALNRADDLNPLPVIHVAGEQDSVIPFENQKNGLARIRGVNGASKAGKPWKKSGSLVGTFHSSSRKAPVVSVVHPGGHEYPPEATELIIQFFKEVTKFEKR